MSHIADVIDIPKPAEFTIDGRTYRTQARWRPAADLLVLAGLDPGHYILCELRAHRSRPLRYENTDIVGIRKGARFVSIRDQADLE